MTALCPCASPEPQPMQLNQHPQVLPKLFPDSPYVIHLLRSHRLPFCKSFESLSLPPSNGESTCPSMHGNGHCGWVPEDGTVHAPPHARGADTCTSPFFTMRIDSLLVRLYVTCIAILTQYVTSVCSSDIPAVSYPSLS